MSRRHRAHASFVLVGLAVSLVACVKKPQNVKLSSAWPGEARAYGEVVRDWTRSGDLVRHFDKLIEVHATFKSPEWRTAWVQRASKEGKLPDAARAALLDEHKAADAKHYEMTLLVSTYDGRENDLQKGAKSTWQLALVDDRGNRVLPASIKRDRRPDDVIRADFPLLDDFAEVYNVTFPRTIDVLRDDAKKFSLQVSSSRGGVLLTWFAR